MFLAYVLCFESCRCFYLFSFLSSFIGRCFQLPFFISVACFFFCYYIGRCHHQKSYGWRWLWLVTQNCTWSRTLTMILVCLDILWTAFRTPDDSWTATLCNSAIKLSIGELVSNPGSSTIDVKFSSLRIILGVSLTRYEFRSALVKKYIITIKLGKIMGFILV